MIPRRSLPLFLLTAALAPLSIACSSESSGSDDDGTGGAMTGTGGGAATPSGVGGTAAVDPNYSWSNKTYLLKIPDTRWTKPPSPVGEEVGPYVPPFLINIGECSAAACTVTLGTAVNVDPELGIDPTEQEPCNVTTLATAVVANPPTSISFGPLDLPIFIRHLDEPVAVKATARNLMMTNVLPTAAPPDGISRSGIFTATIDIREIYPMFTLLGSSLSADSVCTSLADMGQTGCQPCPDSAPYCLDLQAEMLGAKDFTGVFQPMTAPTGTDCATAI